MNRLTGQFIPAHHRFGGGFFTVLEKEDDEDPTLIDSARGEAAPTVQAGDWCGYMSAVASSVAESKVSRTYDVNRRPEK